MFCENCGKELPDGAAFCNGCGAKQGASQQAAPEFQQAPQYEQPVNFGQADMGQPNFGGQNFGGQDFGQQFQAAPRAPKAPLTEEQRQKRKKIITLASVAVAAIVVVVIVITVLSSVLGKGADKKNKELYEKYETELDATNKAAEEKFLAQFNMTADKEEAADDAESGEQ